MVKQKLTLFSFLIFSFMLLFSISALSLTEIGQLQFNYMENPIFQQGYEYDFFFTVFEPTLKIVDPSLYTCNAIIQDGTQTTFFNDSFFDSIGEQSRFNITLLTTGPVGIKPFIISCVHGTKDGAISGEFTVTRNGEQYFPENTAQNNSFLVGSFGMLAIIFFIITYMFKGEEKEVRHLRGLFFYLGMVHLFIISLIIGTASNCVGGLCGDINRFSEFTEAYIFIMGSVMIYVLYNYAIIRANVTQRLK